MGCGSVGIEAALATLLELILELFWIEYDAQTALEHRFAGGLVRSRANLPLSLLSGKMTCFAFSRRD
jgi:hypothetical protein